ncbi:MAG: hypothetical protein JWQ64_2887 [Subtercola sp.]|nr:hypothetical protein [Subtercola sp.]
MSHRNDIGRESGDVIDRRRPLKEPALHEPALYDPAADAAMIGVRIGGGFAFRQPTAGGRAFAHGPVAIAVTSAAFR